MENDILDITSDLKYLEYAGIDISYHITGDPSENTLILIPGWAGSLEFWYKQIAFFSQHFRVLAIDIPGFGHSNVTEQIGADSQNALTMEKLARGITNVILHEKVSSCFLAGHSIGGALALCVGAQIPDIVKCVIGADSFVHLDLYPALSLKDAQKFAESLEEEFETSVSALADSYFSAESDEAQRDYVCRTMSSVTSELALTILQNFLVSDLGEQLDAYNGPVHAIVSEDTYKKRAFFENYGERVNVISIEETCHFIMIDKPELFNSSMMNLLSDIYAIEAEGLNSRIQPQKKQAQ